jgi:hypothetical protein
VDKRGRTHPICVTCGEARRAGERTVRISTMSWALRLAEGASSVVSSPRTPASLTIMTTGVGDGDGDAIIESRAM